MGRLIGRKIQTSTSTNKPALRIFGRISARLTSPSLPELRGIIKHVVIPKNFDNKFRIGQKVLFLHFEVYLRNNMATMRRDIISLVRLLEQNAAKLKAQGFAGVYGDTPNSTLLNNLQRRFRNAVIIDPPKRDQVIARNIWVNNIDARGYSERYRLAKVQRMVIVFE